MTERVVVERMGQQGDGVATARAGLLHLAKVLPGEVIEVADGKLVKVIEGSPDRVPAFCAHYATCGGCKFQHWHEGAYAAWKRAIVVDALKRAGIDVEVGELVDAHGAGRRRVTYHVRERDGTWQAGFMEAKSHVLTAIDVCPVLEPGMRETAAIAAAFGPILRVCDVSVTLADNGLDVAVKAERSAVAKRLSALQMIFLDRKLARLTVNGEALFVVTAPFVVMGKAKVPLPLSSFLQATREGETVLAEFVGGALEKSKNVIDLFCGVGPFALRLAERARVHAVDIEKTSVGSLEAAVKMAQGLKPVTAEVRDLIRNPMVAQELNEFDGVVLDPPRAGAEAQVRMIAKSKVKRVVSVSCDAQTFARDAQILIGGGYKLKRVLPIDQFKWTAHVEILGEFAI
jgi:23S rRNA (uracil1939-C5)-methyltransferase